MPTVQARRAALSAILIFVALCGTAVAAHNDDPIAQGLALRRTGDDQGALPFFQKAYQAKSTPRAAAQLGFCEQALGNWTDAETHLTEALKASDDAWVRKNLSTLEASLVMVKSHIGRLEILGEPAGAEVAVNGIVVGTLPLAEPVRVGAAEVEVELRAPGYARLPIGARRGRGHAKDRAARRTRDAGARRRGYPRASTGGPIVRLARASGDDQSAPHPTRGETRSAWRAPARWVSLGLGAVSLGVGVYGTLHNRSLVDQFDAGCGIDPTTGMARMKTGSSQTDASCAQPPEQLRITSSTLATIGLVGAGVFVAAGVVLWLTDPPAKAVETALQSCAAGPAPDAGFAFGRCANERPGRNDRQRNGVTAQRFSARSPVLARNASGVG